MHSQRNVNPCGRAGKTRRCPGHDPRPHPYVASENPRPGLTLGSTVVNAPDAQEVPGHARDGLFAIEIIVVPNGHIEVKVIFVIAV